MEFMRHSEMRLTTKTYTVVAHLPLAEAAEMLPKFTTKKGTHNSDAAGHLLSSAGANAFGSVPYKDIENKGDCHALALAGAEEQELELEEGRGKGTGMPNAGTRMPNHRTIGHQSSVISHQ